MQLFKTLLPLLLTSTVAAEIRIAGQQIALGGERTKEVGTLDNNVPGKNPLNFCEDPKDNIVEITSVDLDPNPPEAGKTLDIVAKGKVSESVEKGAYVTIVVKYGLIKILTLKEDLCDQLKNVDKECPVEKGEITLKKSVELPSRIPPGKYTVRADAFTKDDDKLTCLEATVHFG
ncbi:MAG: Phosphatidylglycerol/phosphatidylinositol transfer protein [Stictis urceolatum]|nr:Phosphatidylglycerol/phosphatidylinositol transfer protein [Stictis urceolata]